MNTQDIPRFPIELETVAKRIATDIKSEGLRLPCCTGESIVKLWRRDIAGETLYIALRPQRIQLSLAERSAVEVKAARDACEAASGWYSTLRNRSEWCRGVDPEDIDTARQRYQDARQRFDCARSSVQRRWQNITSALTPLLESVVREETVCPTGLCRVYRSI